ncbi:MAG: DUF6361 family protein [Lachnospiraceae bacterium]|nr:DUF6361 family protein [Lachnospiraceae bacterium]
MQIGWIDYSKEERNKILSILRLLSTQGTVDEIGIGSVRDAFSDLLFPGISVLHTRAKYFVLIPYLFESACEESAKGKLHSGKDVRNFIERREDKIVGTLMKSAKNDLDRNGIIGSRNYSSGRSVKMKPSSIYWNGLRTSSILLHPELSLDNACNAIYQKGRLQSKIEKKNETLEYGADDKDVLNDGHLIFAPIHATYDYMNEAQINLTKDEADYIFHCFTESFRTKDAVMAYMLRHPDLVKKYDSFEDFDSADFPGELSRRISLASQFADFIYGAHLLYNIIFSEGCGVENEIVKNIRDEFEDYCVKYHRPNLDEILTITNCKGTTATFFREFDSCITNNRIKDAEKLIVDREASVKTSRRKLLRPEEYQFKQPVFYYKLNYRYDVARQIMNDIIDGMEF